MCSAGSMAKASGCSLANFHPNSIFSRVDALHDSHEYLRCTQPDSSGAFIYSILASKIHRIHFCKIPHLDRLFEIVMHAQSPLHQTCSSARSTLTFSSGCCPTLITIEGNTNCMIGCSTERKSRTALPKRTSALT